MLVQPAGTNGAVHGLGGHRVTVTTCSHLTRKVSGSHLLELHWHSQHSPGLQKNPTGPLRLHPSHYLPDQPSLRDLFLHPESWTSCCNWAAVRCRSGCIWAACCCYWFLVIHFRGHLRSSVTILSAPHSPVVEDYSHIFHHVRITVPFLGCPEQNKRGNQHKGIILKSGSGSLLFRAGITLPSSAM